MNRILSLTVALTSALAFSPTLEAKPDKDKGRGGGGGRGDGGNRPSARASAPSRPQMRAPSQSQRRVVQSPRVNRPYATYQGNRQQLSRQGTRPNVSQSIARQNVARQNATRQNLERSKVKRTSPSVALTGRNKNAERGANWNQRQRWIYREAQRQERREDREEWRDDIRERWEDWDDDRWDYYRVPYDVHRYWDDDYYYSWNNHRYGWFNNAWVMIDPGWGYGSNYGYGYYDSPRVYSQGYSGGGSVTARVQAELAREGYNPGPIDGVLGPATRDAIIAFQRDHELPVTGRIDTPLVRELGL